MKRTAFCLLFSFALIGAYAQTILNPPVKPVISGIKLSSPPLLAFDIARNSPDPAEATRRMKQQGVAVNHASGALKTAFKLDGATNYKTLANNGYQKLEAAQATKIDYEITTAGPFNTLLKQARETLATRTLFIKEIFGLSFDQTFTLLASTDSDNAVFSACVDTYPLTVDEVVQTSARYANGRFIQVQTDVFFPNPANTYKLIRDKYPATGHFVIWAKLLTKGYSVADVARNVPIGEFSSNGAALDNVATCVRTIATSSGTNPSILISISPDGTSTTSAASNDCWTRFISQMKAQGITLSMAKELVLTALICQPAGNNLCEPKRQEIASELVTSAGYSVGIKK